MKKVSLILILTIILFSCGKDDDVTVITENITISNTETYKYDLGGDLVMKLVPEFRSRLSIMK